jgi:hypothetical protein
MKYLTLGDFVTAQSSKEQKSRLSLLPVVIYNKFIAKHLTGVDELCVQLATSREPRALSENEMKDAVKSDTDKEEDAEWDNTEWDDAYDSYYDPDFSPLWVFPLSDCEEEDDTIDNESDKC